MDETHIIPCCKQCSDPGGPGMSDESNTIRSASSDKAMINLY